MANLYELTEQYITLQAMAEDEDIDAQAFADTLEGLDYEIEEKANGYAIIMKNIESDMDGIAKEIDRLQKRKKSYENKVESLKNNLEKSMRVTGKTKFKTELFSFGIQKNPASLVIDNPVDVPPHLMVIKEEPDKAAIKELLKNGHDLGYAHLEQKESLRIR